MVGSCVVDDGSFFALLRDESAAYEGLDGSSTTFHYITLRTRRGRIEHDISLYYITYEEGTDREHENTPTAKNEHLLAFIRATEWKTLSLIGWLCEDAFDEVDVAFDRMAL